MLHQRINDGLNLQMHPLKFSAFYLILGVPWKPAFMLLRGTLFNFEQFEADSSKTWWKNTKTN